MSGLFVDIDPSTIVPQLVEDFENALGVVLKAGDQRREFLQGFGYVFTTALQQVEMTGEVNLLQYAYGTYLDKLGELVGVTRLPADYADCTVQFTLSGAQPQAVQIPEGTRVTPDGALGEALRDRRIYVFCALKLLLIPAASCLAIRLGIGDGGLTGLVSVLLTAMPAPSCTALFSRQYGGDYSLATRCVLVSTLLSAVTIPLWIALIWR